jgi:hypothetical protein
VRELELRVDYSYSVLSDLIQISQSRYGNSDQHYYQVDNFTELAPAVEVSPAPAPGFNAFVRLSYRFL